MPIQTTRMRPAGHPGNWLGLSGTTTRLASSTPRPEPTSRGWFWQGRPRTGRCRGPVSMCRSLSALSRSDAAGRDVRVSRKAHGTEAAIGAIPLVHGCGSCSERRQLLPSCSRGRHGDLGRGASDGEGGVIKAGCDCASGRACQLGGGGRDCVAVSLHVASNSLLRTQSRCTLRRWR